MHRRWPRGEESYQGKLLESRDNDYKDEIVLAILTLPIIGARIWGLVERSGRYGEDKHLFRAFLEFAEMVYKSLDPCSSQRFWYKGNTDI